MSDVISRLNAALEGRYTIERELGAGGMATVYLAEDVKHHRKVALKVLRPDLAATLGSERFLREIEIAANLTHPHILPLYDSGEADGFLFYVLPYIDGESLRDRLVREGELPVGEVVRILRDIVDALAHAHDHGLVHRDIKPDNVMLSGRHALVTDFGVAKAVSQATGRHQLTTIGVALGTPAYMAPEQAEASDHVDHRSDIYAVGALGYELLAGQPPFPRKNPQMVLVAHVTETPEPITEHRSAVPPALAHVVMRCLEKKPADRWQSAEEMLRHLEALATSSGGLTPTGTMPVPAVSTARRGRWAVAAFAVIAIIAVGALISIRSGPTPITVGNNRQVTFDLAPELTPAISPDGRQVAYTSTSTLSAVPASAGSPVLASGAPVMVRQIDGGRAIQIAGETEHQERFPRWTPDGSQVIFGSGGGVYSVRSLGGVPRPIFLAPPGNWVSFPAWSPDGRQLAYRQADDTLSGTGTLSVYSVDTGVHREVGAGHWPVWSPDGRWIAYVVGNASFVTLGPQLANVAPSAIHVVAGGGGPSVTVVPNTDLNVSPAWLPDGRLLFVSGRGGGRDVYVVELNDDGTAKGQPERVTTGLNPHTISVSRDGRSLVYSTLLRQQNVWSIDVPQGDPVSGYEGDPVTTGRQVIEGMAVSPDGQSLAFDSNRSGNAEVWVLPLAGGPAVQVTDHPADEFVKAWSPDGQWLTGHGFRNGNRDIYVVRADGTGYQIVHDATTHERYPDWSPDGQSLVFESALDDGSALFIVNRGDGTTWSEPVFLARGRHARWSPNGSLIAFRTSGTIAVIDRDGGQRRQLFEGGAVAVSWSSDSRELIFLDRLPDGTAAFRVVALSGGPTRTLVLFQDPLRPPRPEFFVHDDRIYYTYGEFEGDIWVMDLN